MAQQTAVQWLESELDFLYQYMSERDRSKLFEQAKEMEKEQIMNAYENGSDVNDDLKPLFGTPEEYYNETYKNK